MAKRSNTKAEITKIKKVRTPRCVAAFAYLTKPDDSFGKERHRITCVFQDAKNDPEAKKFIADLVEMNNTFRKEHGKKPEKCPSCLKKADEKQAKLFGCDVGTLYMEFESNVTAEHDGPIPRFNAAGEEDTGLTVYGGDIVRVEAQMCGWELPSGLGIKGYLRAVQLLKSNFSGGSGSTFEVEEDYLTDDEDGDGPEAEGDFDNLEEEAPFEAEEVEEEAEEEAGDDEDPTAGLL